MTTPFTVSKTLSMTTNWDYHHHPNTSPPDTLPWTHCPSLPFIYCPFHLKCPLALLFSPLCQTTHDQPHSIMPQTHQNPIPSLLTESYPVPSLPSRPHYTLHRLIPITPQHLWPFSIPLTPHWSPHGNLTAAPLTHHPSCSQPSSHSISPQQISPPPSAPNPIYLYSPSV